MRMVSRAEAQMRERVRRVVIHEIAHHFGIDDDRLRELKAYWRISSHPTLYPAVLFRYKVGPSPRLVCR